MKQRKKLAMAVAATTMATMILSACGGGETSGGSASSGAGQGSDSASGKPVELKVVTWQTDNTTSEIFKKAQESFKEKYPNVTVKVEALPYENYMTKLQTELAAGSPPDIMQVGEQNFAKYIRKDILTDLTPLAEGKYDYNDVVPNVLNLLKVDDKIPVMSIGGATIGVYYNKKLFDEANVPYPDPNWTWEEFSDIARKLTKAEGNRTVQYGANLNLGKDWVEPFVVSNGGSYLSDDGATSVGYLNGDATVDTFKKISDLYNIDKVAPNPAELVALKGIDLFATGKVAMDVNGSWAQGDLRNNPNVEFGIVPLPSMSTGKHTSLLYTAGFGISSKSKEKEMAWNFLYEMTSPDTEAGQGWAESNLALSQKLAASSNQSQDPYLGVFSGLLDSTITSAYFVNPYWGAVGDKLLAPEIQSIILDQNADIQKKLTDLTKQVDLELEQAAE